MKADIDGRFGEATSHAEVKLRVSLLRFFVVAHVSCANRPGSKLLLQHGMICL
jgi:hypothetical protein